MIDKKEGRHFKWIYTIKAFSIFEGLLKYQSRYACISLNPRNQVFQKNFDGKSISIQNNISPCFPINKISSNNLNKSNTDSNFNKNIMSSVTNIENNRKSEPNVTNNNLNLSLKILSKINQGHEDSNHEEDRFKSLVNNYDNNLKIPFLKYFINLDSDFEKVFQYIIKLIPSSN